MFRDNALLVGFALFLTLRCCDTTPSECTQMGVCSCAFPDGEGYDLTDLSSRTLKAEQKNYTFLFNLCKNTHIEGTDGECSKGNGTSLCMVRNDNGTRKSVNLGTAEETKLLVQPGTKALLLVLKHQNITTTIHTLCYNEWNTIFTVESAVENRTDYHLLLVSPYACKVHLHAPKGLSTGSLLVILLFVFSGVYFIGGAVALKFLRGATGWEMMPNHEFWCELPSLVRDGIAFTFNCCRVGSYSRI